MNGHKVETLSGPQNEQPVRRPLRAKYKHLEEMGYKVKVSEDESEAHVDVPGLSYEAFDVDGNCKIWSLMRMMGAARYLAYHQPLDLSGHTFMDYGPMTEHLFTFMASSQFEIEKSFYDNSVPKWPLRVKVQLGYIGKSSTNSVSSLHVPSSGQELVKNVNQVVAIDKETRKPTLLPTWWKEKFGHLAVRKEPLIVPKVSKPEAAHCFGVRVRWSETDMYKHTNWASYALFTIDALHHGIKNGMFETMSKEIVKNGIKKMRLAFLGECIEGDELKVFFWEVKDEPHCVYFDIEKEGKTVFQSSLAYHVSD